MGQYNYITSKRDYQSYIVIYSEICIYVYMYYFGYQYANIDILQHYMNGW